jgi:hypothetical protein
MVVNLEFLPVLKAAGMTDFERMYHFRDGAVVKGIRAHSVTRISIGGATQPHVLYLKRHVGARVTLSELLGARVLGRSISPGMMELDNICKFRKHGLAAVRPVAAGRRRIGPFHYKSFLITENLDPYLALEKIIRHHPRQLKGESGRILKNQIIEGVAKLAEKMHSAAFNHSDFIATHVLISPKDAKEHFMSALFDLQRVDRKKWMRLHWRIKTIAEPNFSMPTPFFCDEDWHQHYLSYFAKKQMNI